LGGKKKHVADNTKISIGTLQRYCYAHFDTQKKINKIVYIYIRKK